MSYLKLFLSLQVVLEDIIFKATYGFFGSVLSSYPTEMKEFDPSEKVDLGELVILGFLIFFFL